MDDDDDNDGIKDSDDAYPLVNLTQLLADTDRDGSPNVCALQRVYGRSASNEFVVEQTATVEQCSTGQGIDYCERFGIEDPDIDGDGLLNEDDPDDDGDLILDEDDDSPLHRLLDFPPFDGQNSIRRWGRQAI